MASPEEVALDEALAEVVLEKPRDLASDPEYSEQYKQYCTKVLHQLIEADICTTAEVVCEMLQAREPTSLPFRLCSVGCGHGYFDKTVLEKVLVKFPKAKFHYVGIEINDSTCEEARECFRGFGAEAEIHVGNIQEMDISVFQPFDLVMCINSLYYVTALDTALKNCLKMVKPEGKMVIVQSGHHPYSNLYAKFWLHQNKTPLMRALEIRQTFDTLGIKFADKCTNSTLMDLTECFQDNFQQSYQKRVLSFTTQVNLEVYPPAIVQLVIKYLWSIAEGKPEKVLVHNSHDVMVTV